MILPKACNLGCLEESWKFLDALIQKSAQVPLATYTSVLKDCARIKALDYGMLVHSHIHMSGVVPNIRLENTIIDMYGKCGNLVDAHRTFALICSPNVFSWTAIITAYVKENKGSEAVHLFKEMRKEGMAPDRFMIVIVLKACTAMEGLHEGRQVHTDIIIFNIELDLFVCNSLVDMYMKCGCIQDARQVFNSIKEQDVVLWNAMISGYAQQGPEREAISLFEEMQLAGLKPNEVTCAFVIKACAALIDLGYGKRVHRYMSTCGMSDNIFVANSLLDMYVKCDSLSIAEDVFTEMHDRDVISWTIIMAGNVQHGLGKKVFSLYVEMQECGIIPNGPTFVCALNACAREELFRDGRLVHCQIVETALPLDTYIGSSLIDMYAKCGSIDDASCVFAAMPRQDVTSWNAIIGGCSYHKLDEKANSLFFKMHQAGIEPVGTTLASIIKANAGSEVLDDGKLLHAYVVEKAMESNVFVGSTLVDMYAKCESVEDAHSVFLSTRLQDTVVWNTMMTAYAQQDLEEESVMLFESMADNEVVPSETSYTIILKACAGLTMLEWGKQVHCQVVRKGYESSLLVQKTLLDLYAKCGGMEDALSLFHGTSPKDVVAWTTMITGYALQGCGVEVIWLFETMQEESVAPNEVTFVSALSACSHAGLMDEAHWLYSIMESCYGLAPTKDHFACIVDLFSRSGLPEVAFSVLKGMPNLANEVSWMSLLHACRLFGRRQLAEQVTAEMVKLNPQIATTYVQLSNIYAMFNYTDP